MSLVGLTIEDFTRELAGESASPGGGSAAALAGALSAALCGMAARLTLGREKHRRAWEEMARVRDEADALARVLLDLVDKDTQAYNRVTAAFKMPRADEAQKAARGEAVQAAFKEAALTPLETLRAVGDITGLAGAVIERGNPNCVTDAGVAAQLMRAVAYGAAYNVRVNLLSIKDEDFTARLARETEELLKRVRATAEELEDRVLKGLR